MVPRDQPGLGGKSLSPGAAGCWRALGNGAHGHKVGELRRWRSPEASPEVCRARLKQNCSKPVPGRIRVCVVLHVAPGLGSQVHQGAKRGRKLHDFGGVKRPVLARCANVPWPGSTSPGRTSYTRTASQTLRPSSPSGTGLPNACCVEMYAMVGLTGRKHHPCSNHSHTGDNITTTPQGWKLCVHHNGLCTTSNNGGCMRAATLTDY